MVILFSLSSVNSIAVSQFKKYGYTWIIDSSNNQTYTGNGKNIGSNKIISYSSVGNKTVGLIVTDTNGCTDTSWETLRVYRHPKINFISNNRRVIAPIIIIIRSYLPLHGYRINLDHSRGLRILMVIPQEYKIAPTVFLRIFHIL